MKKTKLKSLLIVLFSLTLFSFYLYFSSNPIERYAEVNPKGYLILTMAYKTWPITSPDIVKEQMEKEGYLSLKVFREFFSKDILSPYLTKEKHRDRLIDSVRIKNNQDYDEVELEFMRKGLEKEIARKYQISN